MASTPAPEHQRPPLHLSEQELHRALHELDAKIQTLRNRAHATAAGSPATYEEHATALETKRARLATQLAEAPAPTSADAPEPGVWAQVRRGIDTLRQDLSNIL